MNEKVKGIVAVVVIIIAVIFIAKALKKDNPEREVVVGCQSCGKIYGEAVILQAAPFPLDCEDCNQKSVYRMLECQDCSATFHLIPGSADPCPKCGS